jgi:DNA (cytosine-5)-methyltransferase 1
LGIAQKHTLMTHGSLFSGAGGFDLAAEREGITNVFSCENNGYAASILQQHFPNIIDYGDINSIKSMPYTNIVSCGFPCQDISASNGNGTGVLGERSGLVFTALRLLSISRPDYIVLENSPRITGRGLHLVLARLAQIGYDAQWTTICASWFGYPHIRERMFIVAYPHQDRLPNTIFRRKQIAELFEEWASTPTAVHLAAALHDGRGDNSDIRRGARIPHRVDRLALIGNAVNVTVAQYVLRCIKNHAQ